MTERRQFQQSALARRVLSEIFVVQNMKISLRTLLIVTAVLSVVAGVFGKKYLESIRGKQRLASFRQLANAAEQLGPLIVRKASKFQRVKTALVEFQKNVNNARIDDVVLGGHSGSFSSGATGGWLQFAASGNLDSRYYYALNETFGKSSVSFIDIQIFAELDDSSRSPHELVFRYVDSKANQIIVQVMVNELEKNHAFTPSFVRTSRPISSSQ